MTEKQKTKTPELKSRLPLSFMSGMVFMVAVMLALPLTQRITGHMDTFIPIDRPPELPPPDEFEVPPPPTVEPDDVNIELEENKPPPINLGFLDIVSTLTVDSFSSADWTIPVGTGPSFDDVIHEIGELTDPPNPVRRRQPQYPAELKRMGVEGTVLVMFIVRSNGTVSNVVIKQSSHPLFAEAVRRVVRNWIFEPGEKDGKAVNTRVRQAIPFRIHQNSF